VGVVGNAFVFDGNSAVLATGDSRLVFQQTDKFSFSFYFKVTDISYAQNLFFKGSPSFEGVDYGVVLQTSKRIYIVTGPNGSITVQGTTISIIENNTWIKLKISYDNGIWRIYTGEEETLQFTSSTPMYVHQIAGATIAIGSDDRQLNFLTGMIDEVKIFNDAVTYTTNTVVVENGEIKSWDKVDGGTPPSPPNTHEIVIENGLIKHWDITSGGDKAVPAQTHAVDILRGLVQSWGVS
jgi:hypothetical protein